MSILPSSSSALELTQRFSTYFIDKIQTIRDFIDACNVSNTAFPTPFFTGSTTMSCFKTVSKSEVRDCVVSSAPKSCLLDPFPTSLLIENVDCIIDSITSIVNYSLLSGFVPPSFKHALVSPLLKKNDLDPEILKNYRPVSNLSFISKILEKIVAIQLNDHLSKNSLLELHQSAYRKLHNTETALLKIFNDLLISADNKKISILILLDLSAAFDTLDHSILLNRLRDTFGLNGTVLEWFESYLRFRTQSVLIDNVQSEPQTLLYGVPQGSVLGPLCYTLYTTPLGEIIRNHDMSYHMYADDTQLYLSIEPNNINVLVESIEACIKDVKDWMYINKLKLNQDKTEIILCNPKNFDISINTLKCGDESISISKCGKNLGVTFDDKLSMSDHILSISKAIYCEIRRLKQISHFVTSECSLKKLASSFILSRLDYCNSLFINLPKKDIYQLQKLQNYAARTILKRPTREHATPLLKELHWLPIHARIDYKVAILVFKCLNGLAPNYLSSMISFYSPSRTLRSSNSFLLTPSTSNYKRLGDRAFSVYAPRLWNKLPINLRTLKNLNTFKTKLKTYLFKNNFD